MPPDSDASVELVAELAAYRTAYLFLLKALDASLSGIKEPARSLVVEQLETQLTARRGELLYAAPQELSPDLQAISNATMQQTMKSLADEIVQRLNSSAPKS